MINLKQQHGDRFKVTFDEAYDPKHIPSTHLDPHYMEIKGTKGTLYPHSNTHIAIEINSRRATYHKLIALGLPLHQDGDQEFTFLAPNERCEELALIIGARKRRHQTLEQRAKSTERLLKTGFKKRAVDLLV
jgi:hypothetical protein